MTIIIIIFIFLVILLAVRISNNSDLIKENTTDKRKDIANMNNARKFYANKKTFKYLLYFTLISIAFVLLCDLTSIDAQIIDYFSTQLYTEQKFDKIYYFLPLYLIVIREIILQVKVGDFLFKYYKVDEPILEENLLKTLLYKKAPAKKDNNTNSGTKTTEQNTNEDNTKNETSSTEETTNNVEEKKEDNTPSPEKLPNVTENKEETEKESQ